MKGHRKIDFLAILSLGTFAAAVAALGLKFYFLLLPIALLMGILAYKRWQLRREGWRAVPSTWKRLVKIIRDKPDDRLKSFIEKNPKVEPADPPGNPEMPEDFFIDPQ